MSNEYKMTKERVAEYRILEGYGKYAMTDLKRKVNEALKEGWELVGGVSTFVTPINKTIVYSQAVIKR